MTIRHQPSPHVLLGPIQPAERIVQAGPTPLPSFPPCRTACWVFS